MTQRKTLKTKNKMISRVLLFLVFFLVFFICFVTIKEVVNRQQIDKEIKALNEELINLKLEQQSFLSSIDHYESNFFVEREARSKLNMKKEGENVVVVKLDEINNLKAIHDEASEEKEKKLNNPQLWWHYFFN